MSKNELTSKLAKLRNKCEDEGRSPNRFERQEANKMIDQLERMDSESFFFESRGLENTMPNSDETLTTSRSKGPFKTFGDQLMAVRAASMPGQATDHRLYQVAEKRAATGLSESIPSEGGFLVDSEFSNSLLKNIWSDNEVLKRITLHSLSGNTNGIKLPGLDESSRVDGSRQGGIQAYWKSEAAEKTASKPTFRLIELNLNKLVGLVYSSDELFQDVNILESFIKKAFAAEFDFKLADAVINGSGAGTPLGILNSGCVVSVSKETGQAADTIVYENVLSMWARLMASSRSKAIWIINQNVEPQLYKMSLSVGTGGVPVYLPSGGAAAQPFSTLFGRPVVPIEQCPNLGETGDIMLCDFSQYLGIDKGGMKSDVSMHVRYIYDESVFRFVYRFDGQPVLASAITPFKGTDTLSHFIKLNERA